MERTAILLLLTVAVPSGKLVPLFGLDPGQEYFPISAFTIDRNPVTHAEFRKFVRDHKEWSRAKASAPLVDSGYLAIDSGIPDLGPATQVSWFAAQAYCESKGGRLPDTLDWEYVAAADQTRPDATRDPVFASTILNWYAKPSRGPVTSVIGAGKPNFYGVSDLHALIWEWTFDFNSVFVTADNRQDGDKSADFTCGNGATASSDRGNYAAFMRYAMRNSLQAHHTSLNLGFRCAYY